MRSKKDLEVLEASRKNAVRALNLVNKLLWESKNQFYINLCLIGMWFISGMFWGLIIGGR